MAAGKALDFKIRARTRNAPKVAAARVGFFEREGIV